MGDGPRCDVPQTRKLPNHQWTTCQGCPSFRVFDWHYFYCRHLGDQTKPDAWNAGWKRVRHTHNEEEPAECGFSVQEQANG